MRTRLILQFCLLSLAVLLGPAQAREQIITARGEFTLLTQRELETAQRQLAQSRLSEEERQNQGALLSRMGELLGELHGVREERSALDTQIREQKKIISRLQDELHAAEQRYAITPQDFSGSDEGALAKQLSDLSVQLQGVQAELASASSDFISIQTLPSRAPRLIADHNERIGRLAERISEENLSGYARDNALLEAYILEQNITLTRERLLNQATLEDIADYSQRISTLHSAWLSDRIRQIQDYQNQQISQGSETQNLAEKYRDIPELQRELQSNETLGRYLEQRQKANLRLASELTAVEDALAGVRQIESNLKDQVDAIGRSLVLSRLLSRQQAEIPGFTTSFDLDELIPDLSIWIYDLRRYREELFNIQAYADGIITKNPALEPYRSELEHIIRQRRSMFDDMYSALSGAHTQAISLKLKNQEYQALTGSIRRNINDQLFWIASNQPLGLNFLRTFRSQLMAQANSINDNLSNPDYWSSTLHTLITILLPFLVLGLAIRALMPRLTRLDNRLALRLDRPGDGFLTTPLALLNRLVMIIPKVSWIIVLVAIFVYVALDNSEQQVRVTLMIALHITVFVFYIDLLRPNSFFQRHFCVSEKRLARQRSNIDQIYKALIPILIVANFRENNPAEISSDVLGFTILLAATIYLTYITMRFMADKYRSEGMSFWEGVLGLLYVAVPLLVVIMLAFGYYYTAVKLINRLAFSFYIFLGYTLVSNIIRRGMYVAELRMIARSQRERLEAPRGDDDHGRGGAAAGESSTLQDTIENLRVELISSKASRLINIALLTVCLVLLYLLWADLASIVGYLDTIVLISSRSVVDGREVVENVLTMANIFSFLVILAVAAVLNRNLPYLLERLFMLRSGASKSTSYTAKILTSYTIITLAIIFAAGALGIAWDDLQWLVAALSVGLGFGLQEIFANFVSGLIILFERQIRVGDVITLSGLSGTVNKIRIRSTTIVSFDNKEVMIPNRQFITSALTNWSLTNTVTMLEFSVGVAYGANVERAKEILTSAIRRCEHIDRDRAFRVYIKGLDESCVTIMCEVFVSEIGKRKTVFDYLSTQALRQFAREGIEIPFNQLDVTLRNLDNGDKLQAESLKA